MAQRVLATFSGIAIVSATVRIVTRFRYLKGARVDDYLFLAAAIFKVVADGLLFASYTHRVIVHTKDPEINRVFFQRIGTQLTLASLNEVFDMSTIFLIKMSFLFYFRRLVDKLPTFNNWWWINLGLLLPTTVLMIAGTFIICPHLGRSIIGSLPPLRYINLY